MHTRNSPESPQCARCFVLVLVCVEQGDTAARVSSLRVRGVGVIGPDHKETSSPQLLLPPHPPSTRRPPPIWEQWSDFTVTKSSMSFSSTSLRCKHTDEKGYFFSNINYYLVT